MSAADFLLTRGMQKVLAIVLADPERSLTLNELLAVAGGGRGSSQSQIERLIEAGILQEGPRRARQRSIKANTGFFLYAELKSIALKSFGLAEPLRETLRPFQKEIDEAFVFGSVAQGTDTHRSDVDLIVVGQVKLMKLNKVVHDVSQLIGRPIHLNLYTADEWSHLKQSDPVLSQISEANRIQILPDDTPD